MIEYDDRDQIPYVPVAVKPQWAEIHRRPGALASFDGWRGRSTAGPTSLPPGVLSFLSEAREVSGSETARFHHAARRCSRRVAACQRSAAAEGADDRRAGHWQYRSGRVLASVSARAARFRVRRRAKHSI